MRTKTIKIRAKITEAGYEHPAPILQAIRDKINSSSINVVVEKIWIAHK